MSNQKLPVHIICMLFPLLPQNEYERLKADIEQNGQLSPIYTYRGEIIDGKIRYQICLELGIEPWIEELAVEVDPLHFAMSQNLHRRHLSFEERVLLSNELLKIETQLAQERKKMTKGQKAKISKDSFGRASEKVGQILNISARSVRNGKVIAERGSELLKEEVRQRKRSIPEAVALVKQYSIAEQEEIIKGVNNYVLRNAYHHKNDDIRNARHERRQKEIEENLQDFPKYSERYTLHKGFVEEVGIKIPNESIDYILTDPPYLKNKLYLYEELGALALRVLRAGGLLITMARQSTIHIVVPLLEKNGLKVEWVSCYFMPHGKRGLSCNMGKKLKVFWKPLIMAYKPPFNNDMKIANDIVYSGKNIDEKDSEGFVWAQSEIGAENILKEYVNKGSTILDPFMGTGTNGAAALKYDCKFVGIECDDFRYRQSVDKIGGVATMLDTEQGESGEMLKAA